MWGNVDNGVKECEQLKQKKDGHYLYITVPVSQFRRIGDLRVQSPPERKPVKLENVDWYDVEGLERLLDQYLPQFYTPINNL